MKSYSHYTCRTALAVSISFGMSIWNAPNFAFADTYHTRVGSIEQNDTVEVFPLGVDTAVFSRGWESLYWLEQENKILVWGGESHIPTNDNSLRLFDPFTGSVEYRTSNTGKLWDNKKKVWKDTGTYQTRCTQRDNATHWYFPPPYGNEYWVMKGPGGGLEYCVYDLDEKDDDGWTTVVLGKKYGGGGVEEFLTKKKIKLVGKQNKVWPINSATVSNCGGKWIWFGGGAHSSFPYDTFATLEPYPSALDGNFDWLMTYRTHPLGARGRARNSAVCVDNEWFYFWGGTGLDESRNVTYNNDLWKYHIPTNTWAYVSTGALFRSYPAVTFDPIVRAIVIYGGVSRDGINSRDMWLYFIDQDQWVNLTPLIEKKGVPRIRLPSGVYIPQLEAHIYRGGIRYDDTDMRQMTEHAQFQAVRFSRKINRLLETEKKGIVSQ